ncbi:MAG: helix-turn-helix transcriptional regulator [Bacteroidetes bacterium]|nr:helix-turn-helix transcriptional regulator [Bacteroidota bacterium]
MIIPKATTEIRKNLLALSRKLLQEQLSMIEVDQANFCIPRSSGSSGRSTLQHMHPMPEINIQLSGVNNLQTTVGSYKLLPNSICIIPAWLPHKAHPEEYKGEGVCHFVIQHYPGEMTFHITRQLERGKAVIAAMEHLQLDSHQACYYLNDAVTANLGKSSYRRQTLKGLMIAYFSSILDLLEPMKSEIVTEHLKIARCKELIAGNLTDPNLTVRNLAEWIKISPDYLSQLFHSETGQTVKACINKRRLALACHLLREVSLNVSEIAWTCGYRSPGYFTRIFKKVQGQTPSEFRNSL